MPAEFIKITSNTAQGALGAFVRRWLICTREDVTGFTADPITGLYKINSTDLTTFETDNPEASALISNLRAAFRQKYSPDFVYILSSNTGITTALLDKANTRPRDWSIITLASQFQGDGTGGPDATTYFADLDAIRQWGPGSKRKIVTHTYSVEEISNNPIVLPTQLAVDGSIRKDPNFKTIVSNSNQVIEQDPYEPTTYDNISMAWLSFVLNGVAIARSAGSLSDAHDFEFVSSDTYSQASRSLIENNSLGQYNGAKDRSGSAFVYDTQMNDNTNPPTTSQIETLLAEYFIDDYSYVYVHNAVNAPGQNGIPTDDRGINFVYGLLNKALVDCFNLGCILAKADGSPDFSIAKLTAAQVTILSPTWQSTGVWPDGVLVATIKPFGATHYITLNFNFN